MKRKRVLICGHTGATGSKVLDELVRNKQISEIVTVGRRVCDKYKENSKVKQIIVDDMKDLSNVKLEEIGNINIAFDLIATPVSDSFKGEELYRSIDVDMASEFAKLAKSANASYIGSIGMESAKKNDTSYACIAKRDFETYVRTLNFDHYAIIKPMWLDREAKGKWYEKLYNGLSRNVMKVSDIAKILVWASFNQDEKEKEYYKKDVNEIINNI